MPAISARPLADELSFGARVSGVDRVTLKDESVRRLWLQGGGFPARTCSMRSLP
jgi:hypothetical protein